MKLDVERNRWQRGWDGERRWVNLMHERRRKGREISFELGKKLRWKTRLTETLREPSDFPSAPVTSTSFFQSFDWKSFEMRNFSPSGRKGITVLSTSSSSPATLCPRSSTSVDATPSAKTTEASTICSMEKVRPTKEGGGPVAR